MQQDNPITIHANVNKRLLTKAHRLFTGTLQGRIIEILQNARRAGATQVTITNKDGEVTVTDNGSGITDFQELLDLGGSGWSQEDGTPALEQSEDPAGVGLFCLAPRKLVVRSLGRQAIIEGEGWQGQPVEVALADTPDLGSTFIFADEPWTFGSVDPFAAYTGMKVTVEGKDCKQLDFISGSARDYPELGVRIKVVTVDQLPPFCHCDGSRRYSRDQVYANFHGQIVAFDYQPIDRHSLAYLVELTGEPTQIRLMLPARTRLIDNAALAKLKTAIKAEAYAFLKARGHHQLPYKQFLHARSMGIELPEAKPDYQPGLLGEDGYGMWPVEVRKPDDFDLSACYRVGLADDVNEMGNRANAHFLGAFHQGKTRFVPVDIHPRYDGYQWSDLPRITQVRVIAGNTIFEDWVGSHTLICVDTLSIEVKTDDGQHFKCEVPLAIRPITTDSEGKYSDEEEVYVTPAAQSLRDEEVWYHMGGYCDEGDTYDTQLSSFGDALNGFWDQLDGPDESLRKRLMAVNYELPPQWQSVMMCADGTIEIQLEDGTIKKLAPPSKADTPDEGCDLGDPGMPGNPGFRGPGGDA